MRQRNPVTEIRRHDLFSLLHLRNVLGRHATRCDEDGADERERLRAIRCGRADDDRGWRHDLDRHDAFPASAEISSPAARPRSNRFEAVLFMKFLNVSTTALGATFRARSARPSCATTTSVLLGISLTGE